MARGDDDKLVRHSLRLGWSVSELRGRYAQRLHDTREPAGHVYRLDNALPLQVERTPAERAIETEAVVRALASDLKVDVEVAELTGHAQGATGRASERLTTYGRECVRTAHDDKGWSTAWQEFTNFLFAWDARIQDKLNAASLSAAAAYQLGRGLADVQFARDPVATDPGDPRSAAFLLGPHRVAALHALLKRLSPHWSEFTIGGIGSSLDAWAVAVADPEQVTAPTTHDLLRGQVELWHDLLLNDVDPTTLIDPGHALREGTHLVPILKPFVVELGIGLAGLLALLVVAVALASSGQAAWSGVAAALGLFGVTTAGIRARIRDRTNGIIEQMRRAVYLQLTAKAMTRAPAVPRAGAIGIRRLCRGSGGAASRSAPKTPGMDRPSG